MISFIGKDHAFSIAERELFIREVAMTRLNNSHVYLQTCNRVELYSGNGTASRNSALHLFRVASGLESKMLGEGHILGQLRRSYCAAVAGGLASSGLHRLFQHAIYTGRRVRTETAISRGAVTHGQATVSLLKKNEPNIACLSILLIGVNTLTHNIIKGLQGFACNKLTIVNRTYQKAYEMAETFKCTCESFEHLKAAITRADVIISAINSTLPIIAHSDIPNKQALTVIDLGVPRTVDPTIGEMPFVNLYNLGDVERNIELNINGRAVEVLRAEEIVEQEVKRYLDAGIRSQNWCGGKVELTALMSQI